MIYILDANVFAKFKSPSFNIGIFSGHRVLLSSTQLKELMAIDDPQLRSERLNIVELAKFEIVDPVSFAFDTEGRGFDQGQWFRSDILQVLKQNDLVNSSLKKSEGNQFSDVELVMAAIHYGAEVVTGDGPLRKTIESFRAVDGIKCVRYGVLEARWKRVMGRR